MDDISQLKATLNRFDLTPNKALGQNFLADGAAVEAILAAARPDAQDVLEIGPGLGALTAPLAARARHVVAVEIDAAMVRALGELLPAPNLTLLHADFLKLPQSALVAAFPAPPDSLVVCANLPYYVTTPICLRLLRLPLPISRMALMLQAEAAARFFAQPGDRVYGPLAVLSQLAFEARLALSLSPASYYPAPEVSSAVVLLERREGAPALPAGLFSFVDACFAMRRKTLANNLRGLGLSAQEAAALLSACGISPAARAETLEPQQFFALFQAYDGHKEATQQ